MSIFQKSVDRDLRQFSKTSGDHWKLVLTDVSAELSGLYFITARNNQCEEKYPVILNIAPSIDLSNVTDCATENG